MNGYWCRSRNWVLFSLYCSKFYNEKDRLPWKWMNDSHEWTNECVSWISSETDVSYTEFPIHSSETNYKGEWLAAGLVETGTSLLSWVKYHWLTDDANVTVVFKSINFCMRCFTELKFLFILISGIGQACTCSWASGYGQPGSPDGAAK